MDVNTSKLISDKLSILIVLPFRYDIRHHIIIIRLISNITVACVW